MRDEETSPCSRGATRWAVALLTTGLALSVAGCTSADAQTGPSGTTTASSAPTAQLAKDTALYNQLPATVRESGVLRVGIDPTYPPMEYFASDNATIIGSDPELLAAMAKVLGVRIAFQQTSFSALIPGLEAARFDMAMNMGDYFKREKAADFVDFFLSKRAFLIKADSTPLNSITDLCGTKVGMLQGTDSLDKVAEAQPQCKSAGKPAIIANAYPTNDQAVLAMRAGRIDSVFSDTPTAGWAAKQSNGQLVTSGTSLWPTPPYYGMVIPKGSSLRAPLMGALDKVIASGQYAAIFTKWGLQDGLIDKAVANGAKE